MSIRILLVTMAAVAAYLLFGQITANSVLPYAYAAGLLVFICLAVYMHYSRDFEFKLDGRVFWTFTSMTILIVGLTIQLTGKAITA